MKDAGCESGVSMLGAVTQHQLSVEQEVTIRRGMFAYSAEI